MGQGSSVCGKSLTHLEEQRANLVADLAAWPVEHLNTKPRAGEWSAVEVVEHLVKVESAILAAARRGLAQSHRIRLRDRLGFSFICFVFRSKRRAQVPASARAVLPAGQASLDEVRQQWEAVRIDLARFLDELGPGDLGRGVFRHPVSGLMCVERILQFFSLHITHHQFQLERIQQELRRI